MIKKENIYFLLNKNLLLIINEWKAWFLLNTYCPIIFKLCNVHI